MRTPHRTPEPANANVGGPGHSLTGRVSPRHQDAPDKWPLKGALLGASQHLPTQQLVMSTKPPLGGPPALGSHGPGPPVHPHSIQPIGTFHSSPGAARWVRKDFDP